MTDFKDINDVLSYKSNRIITKRIEPYDVIESVKKYYDVTDYTFNGRNKFEIMDNFLNELRDNLSNIQMGLYMKNVNKFYLLKIKDKTTNRTDTELLHTLLLTKEYGYTEAEQINGVGIIYSKDMEYSIEQIDIGKAEAVFLMRY